MAKLSANGRTIVGSIDYIASTKRVMSDGVILENKGHGWKVAGKVKPGFTPEQAFTQGKAKHEATLAARPALAAYRAALHDACGLAKRWALHTAITLMPDDPDGVWSNCVDSYPKVDADLDDIVRLCGLYTRAKAEKEEAAVA